MSALRSWSGAYLLLTLSMHMGALHGDVAAFGVFPTHGTDRSSSRRLPILSGQSSYNDSRAKIRLGSKRGSVCLQSSLVMEAPPRTRILGIDTDNGGGGWNGGCNNNNNGGGGKNWGRDGNEGEESSGDHGEWKDGSGSALVSSLLVTATATTSIKSATASRITERLTPQALAFWLAATQYISLGKAQAGAISQSCVQGYLAKLEANPLLTKAITSGFMGLIGDMLAQYIEYQNHARQMRKKGMPNKINSRFQLNLRRNMAILLDGLLISGPLMHFGYDFFEHIAPIAAGGGKTSSMNAMLHVLADSIALDGVFVATALIASGIFEGYSWKEEIIPQMQTDYIPAWKASFAASMLIAPVEFVSFKYLPVSLRTLAVSVTDIFWDCVLSFMCHRARSDGEGHLVHAKA